MITLSAFAGRFIFFRQARHFADALSASHFTPLTLFHATLTLSLAFSLAFAVISWLLY
jgi:hypothetical protein